ncbi:MAG: hypothetical protein L3J72_03860 [Thermoplasmata archaeon]|nr:hypothetical protein [Thermoplasmata archaeon]
MTNQLSITASETFGELLQLLPLRAPTRGKELNLRADEAVGTWDLHLASCMECLSRGLRLCPEGVYLTQDVVQRRSALEAFEARMLARSAVPSRARSVVQGTAA